MNTTTATTTDHGFVVTAYDDTRWSCTCGMSARADHGFSPGRDGAAHVATHNEQTLVLHVFGRRAPGFIDDLVADLGAAVTADERRTERTNRNSARRWMTFHHANLTINPTVILPADAQRLARDRGFSAGFTHSRTQNRSK